MLPAIEQIRKVAMSVQRQYLFLISLKETCPTSKIERLLKHLVRQIGVGDMYTFLNSVEPPYASKEMKFTVGNL